MSSKFATGNHFDSVRDRGKNRNRGLSTALPSESRRGLSLFLEGMAESSGKVTGIRHIVRLREMLKKWQSMALGPKDVPEKLSGISPSIEKRLKSISTVCDSDEESCQSPDPPPDVPRGYLAVYVGPERRRFVIPTSYLSKSVFKVLLEKAEEEYGFDHEGAITFPCEIETFKYILQSVERHSGDMSTTVG